MEIFFVFIHENLLLKANNMRSLVLLLFLSFFFASTYGQDDLLKDVMKTQDSTVELLPKKMILTQRIFWGEHGLMRPILPLTQAKREKELKLRRGMLIAHQILVVQVKREVSLEFHLV